MSVDADEFDSKKRYKRAKKRRRREEERDVRHVIKLLSFAALGRTSKIEKLIKKHADLDVNAISTEGFSALHHAAKFGHTEAAELLLRLGADPKAEDFEGNTPAHWAARNHHLSTLAALIQGAPSVSLDKRNSDGRSIRQFMQAAIQTNAGTARWSESPDRSVSAEDVDSEEEWQNKLRETAGFDDFESYTADWDSFGGGSAAGDAPQEDEDSYARRMWESMQRRRAAAAGPTPATADAWAQADSAADRRRRAQEDAAQRSRRILEEEQAKDRAWREAVQRGDMGARRAAYEAKWHVFAGGKGPVTFEAVPWLVEDSEDARAIILFGTTGEAETRKRLRFELMRWHPDKFTAKFGARILAADRGRVLDRVKHISQMLNSLGTRTD